MTGRAVRPKDETRRSRWIPWAFVAFFGVVFLANGIMIALAFWSWTGLEVDSAYRHGLEYNRVLEAERAQAALGWEVDLDVAQIAGRRARLELDLANGHGSFITGAAVRAAFVRPTHDGHDVSVVVPRHAGGTYRTEVELPLAGQWDLRVRIDAGGKTYRLKERVELLP